MTLGRNDDKACGSDLWELSRRLLAVANEVRHLSKDRSDFLEQVQALRGELDAHYNAYSSPQRGS